MICEALVVSTGRSISGEKAALGDPVGKTVHCMLCGREKYDPDTVYGQDFYLCWNCTVFWLTDYLRRLKSRLVAMLPWHRR